MAGKKGWLVPVAVLAAGVAGLVAWPLILLPTVTALLVAYLTHLSLRYGPTAQLLAALAFAAGAYLTGGPWAAGGALALTAPAAFLLASLMRRKGSLYSVARTTAVSLLIGEAALFALLTALLGDLAALAGGAMEQMVRGQPLFAQDTLLTLFSASGMLPKVDSAVPGAMALTETDREILISALGYTLSQQIRIQLPSWMVGYAMQAGLISSVLPLYAAVRRGEGESLTPLPDLGAIRIPRKANMAMMLGFIALWLLMLSGSAALVLVYTAAWEAISLLYVVQGLSFGEWFLKKRGVGRGARLAILAACFLLLKTLLFLLGIAEQVFCFRGLGRADPKEKE